MINQEWTIQGRSDRCVISGEPFVDGQYFYTLLFEEGDGFRREDVSEQAFKARPSDAPAPYSFWRTKFEPPPPAPPEPLGKQTAEDLLRRYTQEGNPHFANTRFILALMLERKRQLKEIEVKHSEDGKLTRIYELSKTGEVFVIPDPQLRLDQLAEVQAEVAELLGGKSVGEQKNEEAKAPGPVEGEEEQKDATGESEAEANDEIRMTNDETMTKPE